MPKGVSPEISTNACALPPLMRFSHLLPVMLLNSVVGAQLYPEGDPGNAAPPLGNRWEFSHCVKVKALAGKDVHQYSALRLSLPQISPRDSKLLFDEQEVA
jgi:hypothetical protein